MGIHAADAIVLRQYPFRETSVTLTCLTDRFGKIKGLVKGLRAQPNRYRSAMEPFTINRIVFYDTRTSQLHLISQCDMLSPLIEIQRDLDTVRVASFCVELVDTVVPLEEPQPAIYQLLKQTLERLTFAGENVQSVRIHFIVRLLRLVGFQPRLTECTSCGTLIHPAGGGGIRSGGRGVAPVGAGEHGATGIPVGLRATGYWSARQGGLLCPSCLHEDPTAQPALPEMLSALETLAEAAQPIRFDASFLPLLRQRLDEFLHWRLDRPLKTMAL